MKRTSFLRGMKTALFSRDNLMSYSLILVGSLIGGASYPLFLTPSDIAPGGLTGVATIFHYFFGWPVGTVSLILNLPLFLISLKHMGKTFFFRSLLAAFLFSLSIDLLPLRKVSDDLLLNAVFGGVLLGIGLGLILKGGATTGGTDMIARMIHKRFSFLSVGVLLFLLDCAVILAAAFTMNLNIALYSLICIFVSDRALDQVLTGLGSSKACYIITSHPERMGQRILREMNRGLTGIPAIGEYSGEKKKVLLCVVASRETVQLKNIVKSEDPAAFMFATDTHETLGEGFGEL